MKQLRGICSVLTPENSCMLLKCFKRFAILSFRDLSIFRADFITSIIYLMVYQGIFIIFWHSVIVGIGTNIAGWNEVELVLLVLSALIYSSIKLMFYGFTTMGRKVQTGEIDKYLCRPISPLFALLAEDMKIWPAIQSLFTCCLLFFVLEAIYDFDYKSMKIMLFFISILLGSMMLILLEGVISLLAFWLGDISKLTFTFNSFSNFQRYPLTILPTSFQFFLTWILPIGLVSSIPVAILTNKIPEVHSIFLFQVIGVGFWLVVFVLLWRKALKSYDSMGG